MVYIVFSMKGAILLNNKRAFLLLLVFTIAFVGLVIRLFDIQIVNGERLSKAAYAQRINSIEIEKLRGDILDRNEIPFTNRSKKFLIVLKPLFLQEHEEQLKKICSILGMDYEKIKSSMRSMLEPIVIETDEHRKNIIMNLNYEGVSIINSLHRYDDNSLAKHIIGYINSVDGVGSTGIEKFYNNALTYDAETLVAVVTDGRNNILPGMGYRIMKIPGTNKKLNVKLTLDYHIQKIVEDVMEKHDIKGAVVVEDVNNGDIVAIASKPDFDQNNIAKYLNSTEQELFNRAVASYDLGSIFKIIDLAVMLEVKDNWDEEYFCTGSIKIGDREFKCYNHEEGGHGYVNLEKAFALSCNTYFINAVVNEIDIRKLLQKAHEFGLDNNTGINEQGIDEAKGNLPLDKKFFSYGDIANISIGQGEIMATPIQVADIVATIANGGIKNKINIVDSIVNENGNKVRGIKVERGYRVLDKKIADKIKRMMENVIDYGTGRMISLEKYGGAAGKTGSAETGQYVNGQSAVHGWFAGYFPRVNPKYSVAVFVENGRAGGTAGGPVFEEIAKRVMEKGY